MSKIATHTETGTAPAGEVLFDSCISAGGGSGILDGHVKLAGGKPLDVLHMVDYTDTEETITSQAFHSTEEEGELEFDFDEPTTALLEAASAAYNKLQPVCPFLYVSEAAK